MMRTSLLLAAGLLGFAVPRPAPRALASPLARPQTLARPLAPVPGVVAAAQAFLATLSSAQRQAVVVPYTAANAVKWSNLPCGLGCREGLQLGTLTPAQTAAALAVVRAATGTMAGEGYNETQQIRAADDKLGTAPVRAGGGPGGPGGPPPAAGRGPGGPGPGGPPPGGPGGPRGAGGGYQAGLYFIAFMGTPSATGTWQLQYGGHHLATNVTFENGRVASATPAFSGVEPLVFTTVSAKVLPTGTACAPMASEAATMRTLLNGLTTSQRAQARLSQRFDDVLLGAGQDGKFPARKAGLAGSALTPAQRALVLAALKPWVQDADDATAATLLAAYGKQLAGTYISYSGTGLFTKNGDYIRLDGPSVWIEFVAQTGVVYNTQTHYHSIWRDHGRDYGGNFSF